MVDPHHVGLKWFEVRDPGHAKWDALLHNIDSETGNVESEHVRH